MFTFKSGKGVTLIMVAGVLAILAAMGAGFYTLTISQNKTAARYSDSVRADMMARAGMNDAIARLQEQAFYKTEDPTDGWYMTDWLHDARRHVSYPAKTTLMEGANPEPYTSYSRALGNSSGTASDRFTLNVSDTSGKINVNAGDNLGVILDNLCRVIGSPLVAANLDALQPRRWATLGAPATLFSTAYNKDDISTNYDLYYRLDADQRAITGPDGNALYGDGYSIAQYRARVGRFARLEDIKLAVTTGRHVGHPELEDLERSVKFNALREYITIDSWVDPNTVGVGKFEWADLYKAIDRDKSWVSSVDKNNVHIDDPQNSRGSLVGSFLSIISGHGAGQLRRIKENGIDWLAVEQPFSIVPGPTSCYMIVSKEDAMIDAQGDPILDPSGHLQDDPNVDYKRYPLCIHRAPVNINTASDKVLIAMFMGINVQHGTPLAIGTDADERKIIDIKKPLSWFQDDNFKLFHRLPTHAGLKRLPLDSGKPALSRPEPWTDSANFGYIDNYKALNPKDYLNLGGVCTEAHELAYHVIVARQAQIDPRTNLPMKNDYDISFTRYFKKFPSHKYARGPFKSWDDFYFRVVQPWDDERIDTGPVDAQGNTTRMSLAPMIMAHFNSNTDILKFNPNIEWIDRWGRNFTEMEPIVAFRNPTSKTDNTPDVATKLDAGPVPQGGAMAPQQQAKPPQIPNFNQQFYFVRNMRYKFGEMIDKTDLNRSTTEFTMDAGGVYEIHSTGQVVREGEVRAERKLEALVKVYDVWRESTQRQFVEGHFSNAAHSHQNITSRVSASASDAGGSAGFMDGGKITRDFDNINTYKTLDTLPEPLVPLKYKIANKNGGFLKEWVDDGPKNARGSTKKGWIDAGDAYSIPDVIANRVLPAGYDGQLVLAVNSGVFDTGRHADTFLASYIGDLDTGTCLANGREQSKTPYNATYRVCDTIGLLGLLNDTEIDLDCFSVEDVPKKGAVLDKNGHTNPIFLLNLATGSPGLNGYTAARGYDPTNADKAYEYNMTGRVGDLRADGVYLGVLGVSCKDATLKYGYGTNDPTPVNVLSVGKNDHNSPNGSGGPASQIKGPFNYEPGNPAGCTISMWVKTCWHAQDHLEHEFFNGSSNGVGNGARMNKLAKQGFVNAALDPTSPKTPDINNPPIIDGAEFMDSDLYAGLEEFTDDGVFISLHGGLENVSPNNLTAAMPRPNINAETPSYYVQPFRWTFVGQVFKFGGQAEYSWGLLDDPATVGKEYDAFYNYAAFGTYGGLGAGVTKYHHFGFWEENTGYNNDKTQAQTGVDSIAKNILRPFISTARYPEGRKFKTDNDVVIQTLYPNIYNTKDPNPAFHFVEHDPKKLPAVGVPALGTGTMGTPGAQVTDLNGQPAAYSWANRKNEGRYTQGCFSINNINQGYGTTERTPDPPPPIPTPVYPPVPPPPPPAPGPPGPPYPPPPPLPRPKPPDRR